MTSLVLPAAALAGLLYTITPGSGVLAAFATGASVSGSGMTSW